jgi:O-antigen/teichoic acid export membrane protein
MSDGRTITRNASWLLVATTCQKLIAFAAFTVTARLVGVYVTGEYFYSIAVTSTFVILADLGLTPVVIRSVAAGAEEGRRLLGAAVRLKIFLIPVAVASSFVYVLLNRSSSTIIATTAIATLVMSADALHLSLYGALRGRQKLQYEAIGMFVGQVLTACVAVSAALLGWGAPGLALALLAGSSWNLAWSWGRVKEMNVSPHPPVKKDYHSLIRQAVPFALAGIFVKVYSYLDSLMLQAFHGTSAVGAYSVAYKVTYAFQFIPLVFVAALFPAMSTVYAKGDRESLKKTFAGSLRLMALIGALLSAGISAIAPRFVPFMYGIPFLGSVAPLTILPWVLLPIFIDFPVGSLLNASHRAHLKTAAMGACMVLNALANSILVPRFGPVGAAWAGVISFWFLMFAGIWFTWRDLPNRGWFAWLLARCLISGGITWVAVRILGANVPFLLAVLFGVAFGIASLLTFRLLTMEDLRTALAWTHRRVGPADPLDEEQRDMVGPD